MNINKVRIRTGNVTRYSDGMESLKQIAGDIGFLHERIIRGFRLGLDDAIRIGELLCQAKAALPHGAFGHWYLENTPLSARTAQNYMKLAQKQLKLKNASIASLTAAIHFCVDQSRVEARQARLAEKEKQEQEERDENWKWLCRCEERRKGHLPRGWSDAEEARFQKEKAISKKRTDWGRFAAVAEFKYKLGDIKADHAQGRVLGFLATYFDCFEDPHQGLHAAHNLIKAIRDMGAGLEKKIAGSKTVPFKKAAGDE